MGTRSGQGDQSGASGPLAQALSDGQTTEGSQRSMDQWPGAMPVYTVNEPVRGVYLRNNKFDYPVVVNSGVERWIDYFTGKGRVHFEKYLARGRYFIPVISKILKANNMPQDLVYLAMIESGFNNIARSHASAVGPWQFIRATGRRYGLTVNYWLDQRRDTRLSTMAAIAYLRELYQEFGSWEVASASYNAGENKLRTAIRRYRSRDFWQLSRHRYLKPETRHYVPKIMAAAILAKNPEQFGFENPFNGETPNPTLFDPNETTPKELGEEAQKLAEQNGDQSADEVAAALAGMDEGDEADDIAAGEDADESSFASHVDGGDHHGATSSVFMVANPNEQVAEFEVKGPADLFSISRAAGIPFSTVKTLNPELTRWCTPPNMKTYRIKLPLSTKERFLANYNESQFDRKVVFAEYKTRRGDTIAAIAKKFSTQPEPIRELNGMSSRTNYLAPGTNLLLPVPTGYKRVIASLYDEKPAPKRRRYRRRSSIRRNYTRHHAVQNASAFKK
jgi:hypothetical protein